jgi:hypothetical protein
MANNKNQHFVSKGYLNFWTDENETLFVYDLEKDLLHEKNTPKNICKWKYFYDLDDLKENKSVIDDLLRTIESDGIASIHKLIKKEKITKEDRENIAWFVSAQAVRTPTQMNSHEKLIIELAKENIDKITNDKDKIQKYIKTLEKKPIEGIDIKKMKENPEEYFRDMHKQLESGEIHIEVENKRELWLVEMGRVMKNLASDYINGDWYVVTANKKRSFITSDNPVKTTSFLTNGVSFDSIKDTEISFPLSPKTLLLIKRQGKGELKRLSNMDQDMVRDFNLRTLINADRYIFASNKNLLISLAKKYSNDWKRAKKSDSVKPYIEGKLATILLPSNKFRIIRRIVPKERKEWKRLN